MARMSIDDQAKRDPRFLMLVRLCGWSKRETWGAITDVWEICYDRKTHVIAAIEINEAVLAGAPPGTSYEFGFAEKMVACGLARRERGLPKGYLAITGAQKRIRYLIKASEFGKTGGLKSAELRRTGVKGRSREGQGSLNLPDTLTSVVPDSSLSEVPDLALPPDPEPPPPPAPIPRDSPRQAIMAVPSDPRDAEIFRILRVLVPLHVEAFNRVRAALKSEVRPMGIVGDPAERELQVLLHGYPSLVGFEDDARHVLAIREAEAIANNTLKYLGPSVWKLGPFGKGRTLTIADVIAEANQRKQGHSADKGALDVLDEIKAELEAQQQLPEAQ